MEKQDEFMELLAGIIEKNIISVMAMAGKKVSDKEAENILCNVALYLMEKDGSIIRKIK